MTEWTRGAGIVPVVNALDIDVFVPGNWEFAYGPDVFPMDASIKIGTLSGRQLTDFWEAKAAH